MKLLRAWTMLVWLSFERLLWSGTTLMVLIPLGLFAALPLVARLSPDFYQWEQSDKAFTVYSHLVMFVLLQIAVPLSALAFGTNSLGGDREERTLVFLLVRPVPRWLILFAKFTAAVPLTLGLVTLSFYISSHLMGRPGMLAWRFYLPAVLATTFTYVCLFHLLAVAFRHSTIIGIVYSLFWELLLGNLPGIVKRLAVNYYGRSLMYAVGKSEGLKPPDPWRFELLTPETAATSLAVISGLSLVAAMWLFSRREYRDLT